jgi:hypothetical protein
MGRDGLFRVKESSSEEAWRHVNALQMSCRNSLFCVLSWPEEVLQNGISAITDSNRHV